MNRRRALLFMVIVAALSAAYLESRSESSAPDTAHGGGSGDGARDVTSSHPLPNETASPKPSSHCSVAPGR